MATVRDARVGDYEAFARLFHHLSVPDPTPPREIYESTYAPHTFFVCEGERVLGYGHGQKLGPRWHVMHVVTAPDARGRGVGRMIMDEHERRARASGASCWWLNVKRANGTAIRLYERCGLAIATSTWAMTIGWPDVAKLPAPTAAWTPLVVVPDDDEALDRAFGLLAGEVASQRARPGRVIVGVRAGDDFTGYASFAPAFPGSAPFRARGTEWVGPLLEAMRVHKQPEHDYVRMVIERDETIVRACLDAGARVLLELYRMEAELT